MSNTPLVQLSNVEIHNYRCIEGNQSFEVEPDVTVLVGMNESGKTTILEAIAKCNYFDQSDPQFQFDALYDYPRARYNKYKKGSEDSRAVTLSYRISDELISRIEEELGIDLSGNTFSYTQGYDNNSTVGINSVLQLDWQDYLQDYLSNNPTVSFTVEELQNVKSISELDEMLSSIELTEEQKPSLNSFRRILPIKTTNWDNPLQFKIWHEYLKPHLPVFMYYDEYYQLPGRVEIDTLLNASPDDSSLKTAKALINLSGIDLSIISESSDFEEFKSELEATSIDISDTLFKYWESNDNLAIEFDVDKTEKEDPARQKYINRILDIRVKNNRNRVSLPLDKRSKGFNWFFSFLVWFKAMQEDSNRQYILLLDEPGLNLHALAQNDLLRFIDDLSEDYQVIYTTHSPFMVNSEHLNKVRTVTETANKGNLISDSLQEKDPNTLFPLQAALGYSVAQNLFINKKNLLVEGISDLAYLETISAELVRQGREGLSEDITIVPTGGADKVATFVSLMRGSKLQMVCLLDSFVDNKSKQRIRDLINDKIIHEKNVVYYADACDKEHADVEDMFEVDEYLGLYNAAFHQSINAEEIHEDRPIMLQLKMLNNGKNFNHYLPARELVKQSINLDLSNETLDRFEELFKRINQLL